MPLAKVVFTNRHTDTGMAWYGMVGFNVPLDTLLVISETILRV